MNCPHCYKPLRGSERNPVAGASALAMHIKYTCPALPGRAGYVEGNVDPGTLLPELVDA